MQVQRYPLPVSRLWGCGTGHWAWLPTASQQHGARGVLPVPPRQEAAIAAFSCSDSPALICVVALQLLGDFQAEILPYRPSSQPWRGTSTRGGTSENCKKTLLSISVPHRNTFKKTSAAAVYEELKESCVFTEGSDCLVIDKSNRAGRKRKKKKTTNHQTNQFQPACAQKSSSANKLESNIWLPWKR